MRDRQSIAWTSELQTLSAALIDAAVKEDLGSTGDLTCQAIIPDGAKLSAAIVARDKGVICGLRIVELLIDRHFRQVRMSGALDDGTKVEPSTVVGKLTGDAAEILAMERTALNFLGRLSGIATLTRQYVAAIEGTEAEILDTRKTTPGWRLLEKYAVACGGGTNHRLGLYDGILIKDNHLALLAGGATPTPCTVRQAVSQARDFLNSEQRAGGERSVTRSISKGLVEIEIDSVALLLAAIEAGADIVLLDNMSVGELREAVSIRNQSSTRVRLEASGGIQLDNVARIAATGVNRISVGALTHSAPNFDVGLDYL